MTLQELADLLGAHEWVARDGYGGSVPAPAAFATQRGEQQ